MTPEAARIGTRITVPVPGSFSPAHTFTAARMYAVHGLYDAAAGVYLRPVRIGPESAALFRIAPADACTALTFEVVGLTGSPALPLVEAAARRIAQPAASPAAFYQAAEADPAMRETVRALCGLRVLGFEDLFSALTATITEQQITLTSAQAGERWLLATHGIAVYDAVHDAGRVFHTFPAPQRLAALTDGDLRPLKITFVRIGRILALARAIADGRFDADAVLDLAPDAAYAAVRALSGVGHWTAAWALLRARGLFLPVGSADVALRAAVHHFAHGQPGRAGRDQTDAYIARFAPHEGWASFYLLTRWGLHKGY
jgi:3-methyladenine DNA glycosylase/8-oxoguanine DNA glycosylase